MLNTNRQDNKLITLGICITFLGILLLSWNYLQAKKDKAFETINFDLFTNQVDEIKDVQPTLKDQNKKENTRNTTVNEKYISYYVGYIEIPKIDLKKGFVDKKSKQNNVEQNVTIINPSSYPDVDKGNFILASHSGNGYIGYFKDLYKLKKEDIVYIQYKEKKYTYKIINIYEEEKKGTVRIYRNNNKTTLTLITCTNSNDKTQTIYIAELI